MSPKAYLISCSDHYHHRLHVWDGVLKELGYETTYITSSFDHATKRPFTCQVEGCVQLDVIPYRKNLSIQRILSHWMFARKVEKYLESNEADVIICLLPPNFLAKYLAGYKKRHPKVKLIFDIFDLWPETFPSGKTKRLLAPVFAVWAGLRDRNLSAADFVTTECDLFRQRLSLGGNSATAYLCAAPSPVPSKPDLPQDQIRLCYLGSINNIIDIPAICRLIRQLSRHKPVSLHIIGSGERQQAFIDSASAAGADVIFHGAVYDAVRKQQILDSCHFGLNVMKASVCIGLTMKSVDYLRHGLPMINNIGADTQLLIRNHNIGLMLEPDTALRIVELDQQQLMQMRTNASAIFDRHFTQKTV